MTRHESITLASAILAVALFTASVVCLAAFYSNAITPDERASVVVLGASFMVLGFVALVIPIFIGDDRQ